MGKVSQLESMVKVLQDDLKKVRYDSIRKFVKPLQPFKTINIHLKCKQKKSDSE